MKKSVIFVGMLAAGLAFTACSNDDSVLDNASNKQACTFKLTLPSSMGMQTRAVEEMTTGTETTYKVNYADATCYLNYLGSSLRSDYAFNELKPNADGNPVLFFTDLTAVPESVTVVANAKDQVKTGADKKVITEDEVKVSLANLTVASQNQVGIGETNSQSVQNVTLTGTSGKPTSTNDVDYTATVDLGALVARFEVGNVTAGDGLTKLTVTKVFVNNFYEKSDMNGLFMKTSDDYIDADQLFFPSSTDYTWAYMNGMTEDQKADGKCYAWQLFAGEKDADATPVPHFIFQVSGTVKEGSALSDGTVGTFTNYYVTIDGLQDPDGNDLKITRQNVYQIGDFSVAPAKITPKPEMPKLNLTVTCTVKSWGIFKAVPVVQ